ncbi:DUF1120 domain-containing protein [Klebsiella aerogenes]
MKDFKHIFKLIVFFNLFISYEIMAEDTANMSIDGVVLAGACTPTLSNNLINLGVIDMPSLINDSNSLSPKKTTLIINCTIPLLISWNIIDNRHDTVPEGFTVNYSSYRTSSSDNISGLGVTADGKKIGGYVIYPESDSLTIDGETGRLLYGAIATNMNSYTFASPSSILDVIGHSGFSISKTFGADNSKPAAFLQAVFPLTIYTSVVSASELDITDDTIMEGSTTINLVYL